MRVAGPFTVESLSPHRVLVSGDVKGELDETGVGYRYDGEVPERDFAALILDNLKTSGVQQSQKSDKIDFTSVTGWPGSYICAEGRYMEGETERRAGIFIGPEFGTVARADLVAAAREAGDAGCDSLIACAFSYEGQTSGLEQAGQIADSQGAYERGPAHGRLVEERQQGEPVRHIRRARCRDCKTPEMTCCG